MKLPALSPRERAIVIGGSIIVAAFLIWAFLIDPGMSMLEEDREAIQRQRTILRQYTDLLAGQSGAMAEYMQLAQEYSNQIARIRPIQIPRNIEDVLRVEFERIDRRFNSTIGATRFPGMETNELFNLLNYQLANVRARWDALIATLYLIENAGQLVGFNDLRISGDTRNPRDVQTIMQQANVTSFIFPDKGTEEWNVPNYERIAANVGRNIFQTPEELAPAERREPPQPVIPEGQPPPWTRHITLTGIVRLFGQPQAVFHNRPDRRAYRIGLGGIISNTAAEVVEINFTEEFVKVRENEREHILYLRKYRPVIEEEPTRIDIATREPITRETLAEDAEERAAVDVPADYDTPLGSYTEAQMKSGIISVQVNEYVRRRYRLATDHGMLIYRIQRLGAAEKSTLQRHDVITHIDGNPIHDTESFTYAINTAYANNTQIPLTVVRGRDTLSLTLELE